MWQFYRRQIRASQTGPTFDNPSPVTGEVLCQIARSEAVELGGKSPNIFVKDVCADDDNYFNKAIEGFVMFALNQGEVCTCPSRADPRIDL